MSAYGEPVEASDIADSVDAPSSARGGGAPRKGEDEAIADAIVMELTSEEIAREFGISLRTVSRRRQEPEIQTLVRSRRTDLAAAATAQVSQLGQEVISVLREGLAESSGADRIDLAKALLPTLTKAITTVAREERLRPLEANAVPVPPGEPNDRGWPGS